MHDYPKAEKALCKECPDAHRRALRWDPSVQIVVSR